MPKRQLPIEAELISNRLRLEANVEHQYAVIDTDDDAPSVPSFDPMSNPQSRRTATHVS